ncbi:Ubiquitin carboxyl-terminal hydrolase isozyme L5 [Neolecta irregularis DAH-3]|uniref:ubiquitinyl hydrolase 1 n=1 Tax=Neolecta irregularis (strain DAH-3) TaxID=1198029 RepID=A0A1U7LGG9_NEOID|nr:Ubiquitin carboxyl-terminal hydrolase isozyme L5 [Neolecta irregularis DAH-3]|eukprot:OLL21642.1 Ubiquitin carboxyl-terminal hydrolase isozyme L5 [Neolecta irregularis DAH-3]
MCTLGVKDAQVQELYSIDEDSMRDLGKIYGLIFLFRWKAEREEEEVEVSCPENVWFANQVVDNACASLAILNIVLNCPQLDIGEHLRSFQQFTFPLPPTERGYTIKNFDFLRSIHNQYGRKTEMMAQDIALMEASTKRLTDVDELSEDFHFIAYIHKNDALWELDGLKKNPTRACTEDNWVSHAAPRIQQRMEAYQADEIRFNLLAVDELCTPNWQKEEFLALEEIQAIEKKLDELHPEWRIVLNSRSELSDIPPIKIELLSPEIEELLSQYQPKKTQVGKTRAKIQQEKDRLVRFSEYAIRKKHDYTPFLRRLLTIMHNKRSFRERLGGD